MLGQKLGEKSKESQCGPSLSECYKYICWGERREPVLFNILLAWCAIFQPWIYVGKTDAEAEAPILWPPEVKSWLSGKDSDAGKDGMQEKGETEDEMVGWYHQLNWLQFEQAPGDSEGQGSLAGCSWWSHRIGPDWLTQQKWYLDILYTNFWGLRNSMIGTWCRNQALNQNLLLRVLSPLPVNQICLSPFALWEK